MFFTSCEYTKNAITLFMGDEEHLEPRFRINLKGRRIDKLEYFQFPECSHLDGWWSAGRATKEDVIKAFDYQKDLNTSKNDIKGLMTFFDVVDALMNNDMIDFF